MGFWVLGLRGSGSREALQGLIGGLRRVFGFKIRVSAVGCCGIEGSGVLGIQGSEAQASSFKVDRHAGLHPLILRLEVWAPNMDP